MHPRLTPSNGRVAHVSLKGQINAEKYVEGTVQQITAPVADLLRAPDGGLDSQLLHGAGFLVLEADAQGGYCFGQAIADGYVGYIHRDHLGPQKTCTHRIAARSSHVYPNPDIKSNPLKWLPFGAAIAISGQEDGFLAVEGGGYIPQQHLKLVDQLESDYVSVFESFLGVPYLWGGNSTLGMDCSGAIQIAVSATGHACSRDTDMQEADLGARLNEGDDLCRGDLVFWDGHVGALRDADTLIHANAHHMAVASEPLKPAIERIVVNGGGPVTSFRRI